MFHSGGLPLSDRSNGVFRSASFCGRIRLNYWFPGLREAKLYLPARNLGNLSAIKQDFLSLKPNYEFVAGGHFGGRIRLNSRFSCLGEEEFYLPARTSKNLPDTQDSHSPKPDYEEFVADGHFCYRFRLNSWFPGVTKVELYVTAKILRNLPAKIGKSKIPFPSNRITKNSWSADTLAAGFG